MVREVSEETGYLAPPERFEHLGSYISPDLAESLTVTEGSLLVLQEEELSSLAQEFAPPVTVALRMLVDKQHGV